MRGPILLLALALATPLALAPPAAAHCPEGSAGSTGGLVSTCPSNQQVEDLLEAWNEAYGGQLVFVLVKDFRFHPPVVHVKSGGTLVFLYADAEQNQQHDPRSSGGCASGTALPDPEQCVPSLNMGKCFDVITDDGVPMTYNGQSYPLTFTYTPASGAIQKSRGLMSGGAVGDLTGAKPFVTCPAGTGSGGPTATVIPYHCGIHGTPTSATKEMRGTIILDA